MITPVNVSDSEHIVLRELWARGPLTANEVAEAVMQSNQWTLATVKTLLNRLLTKRAVTVEKQGRAYLYQAKLSKEEYLNNQSKTFVDRVFDGKVAPLVSHFSEGRALSAQDIAELRKLLDDMS